LQLPKKYNLPNSKTYLVVGANSPLSLAILDGLPKKNIFVLYHSVPAQKREDVTYFSLSELGKLPKIDVVFIISAFVPDKINSFNDNSELFKVNVELIKKITDFFKDSRLIYASSVSVYNNSHGSIINEDSAIDPVTPYAISKLWGEAIVKQTVNHSILRISSLIGPGVKEKTFVPIIINEALRSNTITLFGNGERMQNYISFSDAGKLFLKAADLNTNTTYLAVSSRSSSNKQIAEIIRTILPEVTIKYEGIDNSPSFNYDAKKTYNELEHIPSKSITDSINEIIKWKKGQF
jgi:UDP-glucose 4-epimerase